jgi:hypothetical protein
MNGLETLRPDALNARPAPRLTGSRGGHKKGRPKPAFCAEK